MKVYWITDKNNKIMYVGKTTQPGYKRLKAHCSMCNFYKSKVNTWLQLNREQIDWFYYEIECESKNAMTRLEKKMIKQHSPILNIEHKMV